MRAESTSVALKPTMIDRALSGFGIAVTSATRMAARNGACPHHRRRRSEDGAGDRHVSCGSP
jgi:hypothetical protein